MAQTMSILSPKDYIWTVSLADEQDYAKFLHTFRMGWTMGQTPN